MQAQIKRSDTELHIEAASESHSMALWLLFKEAMQPYVDAIWGWDELFQRHKFKHDLSKLETWVITHNERVIGYVQYSIHTHDIFVSMFIIHPSYQSKGYGLRIIRFLRAQNRRKLIKLECLRMNPAAYSFYKKNGFSLTHTCDVFHHLVG